MYELYKGFGEIKSKVKEALWMTSINLASIHVIFSGPNSVRYLLYLFVV